jgi:uncharacterized protein
MLIFKVSELLKKPNGATEKIKLDTIYDFQDKDIKLLKPLTGEIVLIKTSEGVNAEIQNFETEIEQECSRCLTKIIQKIKIPSLEEHFYKEVQRDIPDIEQVFLIDSKSQEIDLSELIRQEILLNFPINPLCLSGCKGLCPQCGKDLNKGKCGCKKVEIKNNPFNQLKTLINPKKNK